MASTALTKFSKNLFFNIFQGPSSALLRRNYLIKTLDDIKKEDMVRYMPNKACESRRYFLRQDQMGFSLHETVVYKGKDMYLHYLNHLEAVFITKGTGWIEFVSSKEEKGKGERYRLEPGTAYALNEHDKHWLGANSDEDMHCICVFFPPCDGKEVHNQEGSFPYIGEDGIMNYNFWKTKKESGETISVNLKP